MRAKMFKEAPAATYRGRVLTYDELRLRSNALAERLQEAGVVRGDRVGINGTRSLDALVAMLGILKAGAAYVPLDDTMPPSRLRAMAEDAGVQVVVVLPGSADRIRSARVRIPLASQVDQGALAPPAAEVEATDCAYVIFTSGSSGRPKPVAVPHRGVVRLAASDPTLEPPGPGDRVLHACGLSSDASTIEIWSALVNGACLVLVDQEELLSPPALEQRLRDERVTIAYLTTSVFHHVARTRPGALSGLRWASAGGEAMDPELARAVVEACPDTIVANFYGPTENSVASTVSFVRELPRGARSVPIGRPLGNSTCYVLRDDGTEADIGEQGELLVGGDGLALGYLGDPELTAERFVPNPFEPGTVLYRTGDLAVWRADGELEYRGRRDRQVKLRGHRIELDEVEARLRANASVGEAVVEIADAGDTLIAYVTPAVTGRRVPIADVRHDLADWLPAQAVPSRLVELPRFPVNRAGKVDRARLAAELADDQPVATQDPAAVSGLADSLAEIWRLTLHVRPVGTDNFFELGGDSVLAAEAVTRTLAVHGIDARHGSALVRSLLDNPTLAGYATAVRELRNGSGATVSEVDFQQEAELGFALPAPRGVRPRWDQPRDVLVTGASGFVGAFLLARLLRVTEAVVHCPVRARDTNHATQRVMANLAHYGLSIEGYEDRVVCFPADLSAPRLGLAAEHHAALTASLDLVLHSGAQVNFLYPYPALRAANVDGTREIVRLAAPRRVPVHFLSTIAVVAGFGTAGVRVVDEDLPLAHADRLTMGYAESKWVAEGVLQDAAEQGLPVAIHRPYEVTGDREHGAANTNTAICSLFKTIAETGVAPDVALPMDFVPVDYLAEAVVHLATKHEATNRVYHLTNPQPATLTDMLDRMRAAGYDIRTMPYEQWVGELVRHVAMNPTSPTAPFVPLCVDRGNQTDMSVKEMYFEDTFPRLGRDNVTRDLAGSGLLCPPVDVDLLDLYLEYFFASGYLERA